MENCDEANDSTHSTLLWCRLNEKGKFNRRYAEVIEARKKVAVADRALSLVYRKTYRAPGPIRAQTVHFRFNAPSLILENSSKSNPGGIWAGQDVEGLQQTNNRKTVQLKGGLFCVSKIWILRSRHRDFSAKSRTNEREIIPLRDERTPSRLSDYISSVSSAQLPVFPIRQRTDALLLRRPFNEKVVPLEMDDELFEVIAKSIDLKALPFKKTAESYRFYESHFPLILTMVTKEGERCTTPSKRTRTPESPMTIMIQRQRLLNQRLIELDCMMIDMEHETEDCLFVTELHDPVFDPTMWDWNKMDVGALRRRYTIDASLREM